MLSAAVFGGHAVHLVVFGLPVAALVGAVLVQELQARRRARRPAVDDGSLRHAEAPDVDVARRSVGVWTAAAGLVVAAAVHGSIIGDHFREYVLYGVFFSALTAGQAVVAIVLVHRPTVRLLRAVAVTSAAVVVLWLASRTSGLPIGPEPWHPEEIGRADIVATIAEATTFVGCMISVHSVSRSRRADRSRSLELAR